jgi:hypothetical protein
MYTNQRMRFGYHREKAAAGEPTLKSAIQLSQKGGWHPVLAGSALRLLSPQ